MTAKVKDIPGPTPARVIGANLEVGAMAAELRARHRSLKLPDAFVVATAVILGADRVLTADRGWPHLDQITQVIVHPDPAAAV